jgi:hypothetical protein
MAHSRATSESRAQRYRLIEGSKGPLVAQFLALRAAA